MKVEFRKSFEKDLLKLKNPRLYQKVQKVIEKIEAAGQRNEIANLKKLKGETAYHRIRVGNYRIGIKVNDKVVSFVRILHRKDIYRYFP